MKDVPPVHEPVKNIQQDIYIKYPLEHEEHMTCLTHTLSHSKNGFIIVTFQPSLNIVGEDPSITPSNPIPVLCLNVQFPRMRGEGR